MCQLRRLSLEVLVFQGLCWLGVKSELKDLCLAGVRDILHAQIRVNLILVSCFYPVLRALCRDLCTLGLGTAQLLPLDEFCVIC